MPKLLQTAATHCFLSKARLSLSPFFLPLLRVCAAVCSRVGLLFMIFSVRQATCASFSFFWFKKTSQSEGKKGCVVTLNQLKALKLFLIFLEGGFVMI